MNLQLDWLDSARQQRRQGTRGLLADTPRSRATDPDTSHQAAEQVRRSGELGRQQIQVLDAVKRWPGRTSTELGQLIAEEIGEDVFRWRYIVGRRLSELAPAHVRRGKPRACQVTGNAAMVWHPVLYP